MQAATAALLTRQIQVEVSNVNAVADYVVKGKVRIIADTSDMIGDLAEQSAKEFGRTAGRSLIRGLLGTLTGKGGRF